MHALRAWFFVDASQWLLFSECEKVQPGFSLSGGGCENKAEYGETRAATRPYFDVVGLCCSIRQHETADDTNEPK